MEYCIFRFNLCLCISIYYWSLGQVFYIKTPLFPAQCHSVERTTEPNIAKVVKRPLFLLTVGVFSLPWNLLSFQYEIFKLLSYGLKVTKWDFANIFLWKQVCLTLGWSSVVFALCYPKVTYSDPKVTHSDPTHLPLPHLASVCPLIK